MDKNKIIEENGLEISIQKIIMKINKKIEEYKETKNKDVKIELIELLKDRDLVYSNDKKTIEKYLKEGKK